MTTYLVTERGITALRPTYRVFAAPPRPSEDGVTVSIRLAVIGNPDGDELFRLEESGAKIKALAEKHDGLVIDSETIVEYGDRVIAEIANRIQDASDAGKEAFVNVDDVCRAARMQMRINRGEIGNA